MRTRKMTDRMLLESLVNKYGKKEIVNTINEMAKLTPKQFRLRFPIIGKTEWGSNLVEGPSLKNIQFTYVMSAIISVMSDNIFPKFYKPGSWTGWYFMRQTGDSIAGTISSSGQAEIKIVRILQKYNKDITIKDIYKYLDDNYELINDYFNIE